MESSRIVEAVHILGPQAVKPLQILDPQCIKVLVNWKIPGAQLHFPGQLDVPGALHEEACKLQQRWQAANVRTQSSILSCQHGQKEIRVKHLESFERVSTDSRSDLFQPGGLCSLRLLNPRWILDGVSISREKFHCFSHDSLDLWNWVVGDKVCFFEFWWSLARSGKHRFKDPKSWLFACDSSCYAKSFGSSLVRFWRDCAM